jgi:hypothetical protein
VIAFLSSGAAMFSSLWSFLSAENNQHVLSWIGGGAVTVTAGCWAVVKFFFKKTPKQSEPKVVVHATNGGVAISGEVHDTKISTRGDGR